MVDLRRGLDVMGAQVRGAEVDDVHEQHPVVVDELPGAEQGEAAMSRR